MLRRISENSPGGVAEAATAGAEPAVNSGVSDEDRRGNRFARVEAEMAEMRRGRRAEPHDIASWQSDSDGMGDAPMDGEMPDRRAGDNQSMAHLRAAREWAVVPELTSPFGQDNGKGLLHQPRKLAIIIGGISAALALFMAFQSRPAPEPVVIPEPIVEIKAEPKLQVLVAAQNIGIGERLTSASVTWADWPETLVKPDYITVTQSPDALDTISDSSSRFELMAGDPIRQSKLVAATNGYLSTILEGGMRAVSVSVSAAAASGGFIKPNDHVDVVMTRASSSGLTTKTVLSNVRVLAIDAQLGQNGPNASELEGAEIKPVGFANSAIATLALDPAEAEVLINAAAAGQLSLALRSVDDTDEGVKAGTYGTNQSIRLTSPFWNSSTAPLPR